MKPATVIIMLKEPRAGRVKTRLGRDIGMSAAAWWFRHQVKRLLRRVEDPRWKVVLAVAPDREGLQSRVWPTRFARIPQGHGDLGQRMARAMRAIPKGPVCVIGADVPGIGKKQIERAFKALGNHQAVFGPAPDGGYWLVGLRRTRPFPAALFQNVRWSSPHALKDSMAGLQGHSIALIDELQDIDTLDDLAMTPRL